MSQIATNTKQSLRLLEAGLISYSDMFELVDKNGTTHYRQRLVEVSYGEMQDQGFKVVNSCAFSLSSLWDIIHKLDKTYEFPSSLSSEQLIENLVTRICYRREHQ